MCPTLSLQLRCLGALGVREKNSFPSYPPPGELARRLFHTLQSCMTDHIVWETVMWNWCQGKHRCKVASFTGNSHVSCHKRQMPGLSLRRRWNFTSVRNVCNQGRYSCQGPPMDPTNYRRGILNFLSSWLGNQQLPFKQANHGACSSPGIHVGIQNSNFALFCRWTQPEV